MRDGAHPRPRKFGLRRIALRVVVFLLLGAVVNVAVAWGCARWLETTPWAGEVVWAYSGADPTVDSAIIGWRRAGAERWFYVGERIESPTDRMRDVGAGFLWTGLRNFSEEKSRKLRMGSTGDLPAWIVPTQAYVEGMPIEVRYADGRGWPFTTLTYFGSYDCASNMMRVDVSGGIQLRDKDPFASQTSFVISTYRAAALPTRAIWPGFAINTLFYAAILWLLFAAPGSVRRWQRLRRGLCAKCAYPVGTSDVCTECGAHINRKIKARGSMGLPPPATPAGTGSERVS